MDTALKSVSDDENSARADPDHETSRSREEAMVVASQSTVTSSKKPIEASEEVEETATNEETDIRPDEVCTLSSAGVDCFQYAWETYKLNEVTETQIFHQIVCEPAPHCRMGLNLSSWMRAT